MILIQNYKAVNDGSRNLPCQGVQDINDIFVGVEAFVSLSLIVLPLG